MISKTIKLLIISILLYFSIDIVYAISPTQAPTPSPTPTNTPSTIELSEIMACPNDTSEWIEIINTGSSSINLLDWYIKDNNTTIFTFTEKILAPQEIYTIEVSNKLNNSGDSVILISPTDTIISLMSYQNCHQDQSFIYYQNQWVETSSTTKGENNIYPTPTLQPTPQITITSIPTPTPSNIPTNIPTSQPVLDNTKKENSNTDTPQASTNKIDITPKKQKRYPINIKNIQLDYKQGQASSSAALPPDIIYQNTPIDKTTINSAIIGGLILISWGGYNLYVSLFTNIIQD